MASLNVFRGRNVAVELAVKLAVGSRACKLGVIVVTLRIMVYCQLVRLERWMLTHDTSDDLLLSDDNDDIVFIVTLILILFAHLFVQGRLGSARVFRIVIRRQTKTHW